MVQFSDSAFELASELRQAISRNDPPRVDALLTGNADRERGRLYGQGRDPAREHAKMDNQ